MQEMLANPAVQGVLAPFIAALIVAALLAPLRLGGLAVVAAFATAVYFIAGFTFAPLTATRKIVLLGLAAPLAGIVIDFAFRPTRLEAWVLALGGAAAAAWIFWPVLAQKDPERALLLGGTAVLALVPLAASLPVSAGAPVWLQALLLSFFGLFVSGIACALAWHAGA